MGEIMPVDIEQLKTIIRNAGELIKHVRLSPEQIHSKDNRLDFVTKYDVVVQNFLELHFRANWPDYPFIGEEQEEHEFGQKGFIVDPIDGTTNFILGIPHYSISVAVMEEGKIVQGVVYSPALDEMFWAKSGKGAYLNSERLQNPDLPFAETVIGIGSSPYNESLREPTLAMIGEIMKRTDIRCLGSSALDLCYVAAGKQGGYFEYEINPWDIAAGMLIAREAGATVTTIEGKEPPLDRTLTILAAGPKIYAEMREILSF